MDGRRRRGGVLVTGDAAGAGAGRSGGRPWLALLRASNLPTVWSNGLAAAALVGAPLDGRLAAPLAGVSLLYLGGMALNDVVDARLDAARGAPRPIAQGRIPRAHAAAVAAGLLGAGTALLLVAAWHAWPWALGLLAAIVAYDLLSKRTAWAALAMGACRALVLPAVAASLGAVPDRALATAAGALGAYVVVLTVLARHEHDPAAAARTARRAAILPLPVLAIALLGGGTIDLVAAVLAILLAGATSQASRRLRAEPPDARGAVMGWIAAMPLVDAFLVAALASVAPWWAALHVACAGLTALAHRRILGS